MSKEKKKIGKGFIFLFLSLICILLSCFFLIMNLRDNQKAKVSSKKVVSKIEKEILELKKDDEKTGEELIIEEDEKRPIYELYPEMEMPEIVVDSMGYIGILEIPALSLSLPVANELNEENLKVTPCRYAGSIYTKDMVLAAHNYASHFGSIHKLSPGTEVIFTDVSGNVFIYEVLDIDVMHRSQVENMFLGDWDLTLFTCVPNTYNRIAVRLGLK